jgi:hypothetical protein
MRYTLWSISYHLYCDKEFSEELIVYFPFVINLESDTKSQKENLLSLSFQGSTTLWTLADFSVP